MVAAVLSLGGIVTWQAYRQWTALNEMGGHMGGSAAAMHGTHPAWYLLGTIVAASVVAGAYLAVRDRISPPASSAEVDGASATAAAGISAEDGDRSDAADVGPETRGTTSADAPDRRLLDLLPDDERRVLEPVIESPGLTQIELRDRSDFSKSKVSQTVTALEKRGLLYREPQGRTYRVYPSEDLEGGG